MVPRSLCDRIDTLVDELIENGGLDSAALASILVAARDSVDQGYCMELSRRVWVAATELTHDEHEVLESGAAVSEAR
jgi:hypothetical protein